MLATDKQLSDEQSRPVAATDPRGAGAPAHLPPAARRPGQDQHLDAGEGAGGRRPFTLATTIRLEEALGVSLRKGNDATAAAAPNGDVAPDESRLLFAAARCPGSRAPI